MAHATYSNCSFDAGAGSGSTGLNETGVGIDALNNGPDSGHDNSGFGFGALQFNTTGVENTATGSDTLNSNTTGVMAEDVQSLLKTTLG